LNAAAQRKLTPPLAAATLALGVLLLVLLSGVGSGVHWNPPLPPAALPTLRAHANLPPPRPLDEFAQIWQQPIFNADRKPTLHTADGGGNLGDMQLTGIIITPNLRMALLHDKPGNRDIRVRQGAALPDGGWTLVEVKPRSVVFDNAGSRTELNLPAGAPIDRIVSPAQPAPGNATAAQMQWLENGRPAQQRLEHIPADQAAQRLEAMRKFREAVQKRRLEQAANPSPSGVH